MADEPKYPVKTVTKAIEIINYLAQDTGNRGIGVSELSRVLGMGKSTVHRLLDTLSFYGYVEQDGETNQYRLGWELYCSMNERRRCLLQVRRLSFVIVILII